MLVKTHAELVAQQNTLFSQLRQHKNIRIKFHPGTDIPGVYVPVYKGVVDICNQTGTFHKLVADSINNSFKKPVIVGYKFGSGYEFVLAKTARFNSDNKTLAGVAGRRIPSTLEIIKKNPNLYDSTLTNAYVIAYKLDMMLIQVEEKPVPTDSEIQALKNE